MMVECRAATTTVQRLTGAAWHGRRAEPMMCPACSVSVQPHWHCADVVTPTPLIAATATAGAGLSAAHRQHHRTDTHDRNDCSASAHCRTLEHVAYRGVVGRGRGGTASPTFFDRGTRPPLPPLFGLKFVQKLVHCCNWLLTEAKCEIISVQQN